MVVLVKKSCIFGRCDENSENVDFLHQKGHISAPDKAKTFYGSSLKSSDSALQRGFTGFFDFMAL